MGATQVIGLADVARILELAEKVPVFPCNRDKTPLTKNGFYDASQDQAQIARWWKAHPDALVGVPTGRKSGLIVIDYDHEKAGDAAAEWVRDNTATLLGTISHHTRRAGGKHYLFRAPLDAEYGSGKDVYLAGKQRRGIDVRAEGGYVIWWPLHGAETSGEAVAPLPPGLMPERQRHAPTDRTIPVAGRQLIVTAKNWALERKRVIDALAHVDPADRDVWVKIGQAIHLASAGNDDGFAVWHAWSAGGLTGDVPSSYVSENDCRYAWASFNKRTEGRELVTLGTLFALAKASGYGESSVPEMPDWPNWAPPLETYTDDDIPPQVDPEEWSEPLPEEKTPEAGGRSPIDWSALDGQEPPVRQWAVEGWLGRGHVTLLAGPPGSGKTAISQTIASALCLGRQVIDNVPRPMKCLMWAGEDDADELWRRQIAIARWLGEPLRAFSGSLILQPYPDRDIALCALAGGQLVQTPMLKELREQIGDYKAEAVFLDSVARLYGGDENNRHQVTQFIAWLTWALQPTSAAICLLGHPAKAAGSEFSGSTAWEASVRARLYFGPNLPDKKADEESEADPNQRWLCKRKTNYSGTDIREVRWADGCMQPATIVPGEPQRRMSVDFIMDETLRVFRRLREMNVCTSPNPGINYLPKVASKQRLLDGGLTERDMRVGMAELMKVGRLKVGVVGQYANRNPRSGLVEG